jgi:D-alanyl-D-alanine carboxypeptidase
MFSPAVNAGPSILFDAATGEVISHERAGEPWYPASLTKLMTAYVVFKKIKAGSLKLDQRIAVSPLAASQVPSKIGIPAGGTITVDLALQTLLVYSANDIAYVLAEGAGGTVPNFVKDMNAEAQKLGLSSTHFVNPNGLFDPRQLTSARDIGVLASTIYAEFPEHGHYFSQAHVMLGKRKLANRNSLIRLMPEADGMKTGFVCNSGFNLVASATRNGRRLIAVVLGAPNGRTRADTAHQLLVDGFAQKTATLNFKLDKIPADELGALVPTDMTAQVCKSKQPFTATRVSELGGWGISFGTFETMELADMTLRGRMIGPTGINAPGKIGVVRMPNKSGYGAMLWNIDQFTSKLLCSNYRSQGTPCDVVAPEAFAQIAALTKDKEPAVKPQIAQGSDGPKPAKKKIKKK